MSVIQFDSSSSAASNRAPDSERTAQEESTKRDGQSEKFTAGSGAQQALSARRAEKQQELSVSPRYERVAL